MQFNSLYGDEEHSKQIQILQQITDDNLDHCWKAFLDQDGDETTEDRNGVDWWFVWITNNGRHFLENYYWNLRTPSEPAKFICFEGKTAEEDFNFTCS